MEEKGILWISYIINGLAYYILKKLFTKPDLIKIHPTIPFYF